MRHLWWLILVCACACGASPRCPEGTREEGGRCVCEEGRFVDADGDGFGAGEPLASCDLAPGIVALGGDCDDDDPGRYPGAGEICNGVDDDCDGAVDEDFECAFGVEIPCETSCGTLGHLRCTEACERPDEAACEPPREVCNGVDDDCDGNIDEGRRSLEWLGVLDEGPSEEAWVAGIPGGLVLLSRAASGGVVAVLDSSGARLRGDRSLDPRFGTLRFARSRRGELLLRGGYGSSPTRPLCAMVGDPPEYSLTPQLCEGELDPAFELLDARADGLYEVWVGRIDDVLHLGVVGFGPAAIEPLSYYGLSLSAEQAFAVTRLDRLLVVSTGRLRSLVREPGPSREYVLETNLDLAGYAAVHVADERASVAQAKADAILVRRYDHELGCDGPDVTPKECVHAEVPASVSVKERRPLSILRIEGRTYVAYVADEGSALGYLELAEDDSLTSHVIFGDAQAPFADVFLADVGEPWPRIVSRTTAGALHLYVPVCALP